MTTSTSDSRRLVVTSPLLSLSSSSFDNEVFRGSYEVELLSAHDGKRRSSSAYASTDSETPIVPIILYVFMHCVSSRPQNIISENTNSPTACADLFTPEVTAAILPNEQHLCWCVCVLDRSE